MVLSANKKKSAPIFLNSGKILDGLQYNYDFFFQKEMGLPLSHFLIMECKHLIIHVFFRLSGPEILHRVTIFSPISNQLNK